MSPRNASVAVPRGSDVTSGVSPVPVHATSRKSSATKSSLATHPLPSCVPAMVRSSDVLLLASSTLQ